VRSTIHRLARERTASEKSGAFPALFDSSDGVALPRFFFLLPGDRSGLGGCAAGRALIALFPHFFKEQTRKFHFDTFDISYQIGKIRSDPSTPRP
jgi:hypothetical protein